MLGLADVHGKPTLFWKEWMEEADEKHQLVVGHKGLRWEKEGCSKDWIGREEE